MSLMPVVDQAAFVKADMGLPSRERCRIQVDFIREESFSMVGQGDDTAKACAIIVCLHARGHCVHAACRNDSR